MLRALLVVASLAALSGARSGPQEPVQESTPATPERFRWNVLFAIADDWGWPHAGVLGDGAARTPTFDGLAASGVLFDRAFVSSPSCTPSRNAILTGQHFFRLGEGANLWSTLGPEHEVYPLLLEDAGYHVGHWRKAWGRATGRPSAASGTPRAGATGRSRPSSKRAPRTRHSASGSGRAIRIGPTCARRARRAGSTPPTWTCRRPTRTRRSSAVTSRTTSRRSSASTPTWAARWRCSRSVARSSAPSS